MVLIALPSIASAFACTTSWLNFANCSAVGQSNVAGGSSLMRAPRSFISNGSATEQPLASLIAGSTLKLTFSFFSSIAQADVSFHDDAGFITDEGGTYSVAFV